MDEETKGTLKKIGKKTGVRVARSILRWKYKKEGKPVPFDSRLESQSEYIADQAHQVIARRGKSVWKELKKIYHKNTGEKGGSEE
ncbi:MAG: hypothetical protein GY864_01555 [Desulfobacterales bacterium]|nr:hypothetical protein [Desulfobacterales bacterium]